MTDSKPEPTPIRLTGGGTKITRYRLAKVEKLDGFTRFHIEEEPPIEPCDDPGPGHWARGNRIRRIVEEPVSDEQNAIRYVPPDPKPRDSAEVAALKRELKALRLRYGHLRAYRELLRETVVDLDE